MTDAGAFTGAFKGVQGLAHVASDVSLGTEWDQVVTKAVQGTLAVLKMANSTKSVRRVVVTSSSVTVGIPSYDKAQHLTSKMWFDDAIAQAKANPHGIILYRASKLESEKALWSFFQTDKPKFALSTILPDTTLGSEVPGASSSSTNAVLTAMVKGDTQKIKIFGGSQHFINVSNVAQLHVEALTNESVKNERILAFHSAFSIHTLIEAVLLIKPDAPLASTDWHSAPDLDQIDLTTVDNSRMYELLGDRVCGLAETVKQAMNACANLT